MSDALRSEPEGTEIRHNQAGVSGRDPAAAISNEIVATIAARLESFQGPVPHPDILRGYEALVAGAAERILAQAERQTDHRIAIERKVIDFDIRRSSAGLWCGFALSILAIAGGCVLVGLGHDTAGATIATAAVASLAAVFVYGTNARHRELRGKADVVPPSDRKSPTA